eukprot:14627622-Heterocapsa_arctica.AAC.1
MAGGADVEEQKQMRRIIIHVQHTEDAEWKQRMRKRRNRGDDKQRRREKGTHRAGEERDG